MLSPALSSSGHPSPALCPGRTARLRAGARAAARPSPTFNQARLLASRLGPRVGRDSVAFGFWAPGLKGAPEIELFTPLDPCPPRRRVERREFVRCRVPAVRQGEFVWAVVQGAHVGTPSRAGSLYRLRLRQEGGGERLLNDPMACSLPYGPFAPAELYDLDALQARRPDRPYYRGLAGTPATDGVVRIAPPTNILQVHVATATAEGTLAALRERLEAVARRAAADQALTPEEQHFTGFDAVQLMPVEPTIGREEGPPCFHVERGPDSDGEVLVSVRRPDVTNWGYDTVISGSAAVNPCLTRDGRPDELVALSAALHDLPTGPTMLILDLVFGHADNQALGLLPRSFFAGPNMYGQDLAMGHPVVRAILLELQRRKVDLGADGVRVDGAQDFKVWDHDAGEVVHDDAYLRLMGDQVQLVAGRRYRPLMIFEDGRPWPREDWETASTYRDVIQQQPQALQWGPLTFAHNTPALQGFWREKWWRVDQIARLGSGWVTGCANHDTLRRGAQLDPEAELGREMAGDLPGAIAEAYDNPAAGLLTHGFLPGVPMEFVQALHRAPWTFVRNTDGRHAVKVMAEEARFLRWRLDQEGYAGGDHFAGLRALGLHSLVRARRLLAAVAEEMPRQGWDLDRTALALARAQPLLPSGRRVDRAFLMDLARAWQADLHRYCNVAAHAGRTPPRRAAFNLELRRLRLARPWLRQDLDPRRGDGLWQLQGDGPATVALGLRRAPDGGEELLLAVNLQGAPAPATPAAAPGAQGGAWRVLLASPGLAAPTDAGTLELSDGQGVLYARRPAGGAP